MTNSSDTWKPFSLSQWEQPKVLKLDNTKRSTFVSCPRKYFYQYIMGYKSVVGSTALRYGIAWHGAMEGFYSHIAEHGWTRDGKALEAGVLLAKDEWERASREQDFWDDYRTMENLLHSFMAYISHFAMDEGMMEIIEPEQIFQIPMANDPEEIILFPNLKPFTFTGRLDCAIKVNQRPWLLEHKTTGQALTIQNKRLHRQPGLLGYTYASYRLHKEIPDGSLIAIHHLSAYKSRKTGLYGKAKIDFSRTPQVYDEGDLENWRLSFMSVAERLQNEMERNLWPMNHDSCYTYGRCGFTDLCEQNAEIGLEVLGDRFFVDKPWDVTNEED